MKFSLSVNHYDDPFPRSWAVVQLVSRLWMHWTHTKYMQANYKHLKELIKSVNFLLCICKDQNQSLAALSSPLLFVSAAIDLCKISIASGSIPRRPETVVGLFPKHRCWHWPWIPREDGNRNVPALREPSERVSLFLRLCSSSVFLLAQQVATFPAQTEGYLAHLVCVGGGGGWGSRHSGRCRLTAAFYSDGRELSVHYRYGGVRNHHH